jgi:hypothetical protein
MKLLSTALVSDEFLMSLKGDLQKATVCRFVIAYISKAGLEAIGLNLLAGTLSRPDSFGVSSLTCSCGFEPLLTLDAEVTNRGSSSNLKYFMDPMVQDGNQPEKLTLFHSKLIYLVTEDSTRSVLYIGSHNWSSRALGGGGGSRNAEATLRLEAPFEASHLAGLGSSAFADANLHLQAAFDSPACLEAVPGNRSIFEEWYQRGCKIDRTEGLKETKILLAIHSGRESITAQDWDSLVGSGIYTQILSEDDGRELWNAGAGILVLVWGSESALREGEQPHILRCRISTQNAGQKSQLHGTNSSRSPIAGFKSVIWDEKQGAAMERGSSVSPRKTTLWDGMEVAYFDFEYPAAQNDSNTVDSSCDPIYQFYFEISQVVFPRAGALPERPKYVWERQSLAMAGKRADAKLMTPPGYFLEADRCHEMIRYFSETFGVDAQKAKVLPYSEERVLKTGKKIVDHPLHDTYLSREERGRGDAFYAESKAGHLVPEIDYGIVEELRTERRQGIGGRSTPQVRAQRVFTMKIDTLLENWKQTADSIFGPNDIS